MMNDDKIKEVITMLKETGAGWIQREAIATQYSLRPGTVLLIEKEFQELTADEVEVMLRRHQRGSPPAMIAKILEKGHTD